MGHSEVIHWVMVAWGSGAGVQATPACGEAMGDAKEKTCRRLRFGLRVKGSGLGITVQGLAFRI